MSETCDPYFDWLKMAIGASNGSTSEYSQMISAMHSMEFMAKLPMDRNRSMDGLQLRVDFMNEHGPYGSSTNRGPCTFLEFLVALAKRMTFLTYGDGNVRQTQYYFWRMISNLGLAKVTDDRWETSNRYFFVEDAVWRVNERNYTADGNGGIFPLKHPNEDQRGVEIWYQMNAWLMENSNAGDF